MVVPDARTVGERAADIIEETLARRPDAVLGLATGESPRPVYGELIRRYAAGRVSLRRARAFLLDEYVGLAADHPAAYRHVIAEEFVDHVDLPAANVCGPDGAAVDLDAACRRYEEAIVGSGGVDVQLLGLGTNGHIAFNEPGSPLDSRTRVTTLTDQTRADNARFFADPAEVPRRAITQGLATILAARHLVLLATGAAKAPAVAAVIQGPVTPMVPGSALQLHPRVTCLLDTAAAPRT